MGLRAAHKAEHRATGAPVITPTSRFSALVRHHPSPTPPHLPRPCSMHTCTLRTQLQMCALRRTCIEVGVEPRHATARRL